MSFIWNSLIYNPILNVLVFLYNIIPGHNIGIAIIVLTLLVRLIILPPSIKAARSQRKLKVLAPQLKELQEKHKGNQQGLAKAQMELYKQQGVSPLSSCLPLLIQLPIILALYYVLREALTEIHIARIYSFIYLPEKLDPTFFGIDLSRPDRFVLPILAGISQYILGMMTTPLTKGGSSQEQMIAKQMIFVLPVMTVFFAMSFPAGLALYWVVTTIFSIAQQMWVNREKNKEIHVRIRKEGDA